MSAPEAPAAPKVLKPIAPERFMKMIPSSKAVSPPAEPGYAISLQRREEGRWQEVASWVITATTDSIHATLNFGIRPRYRVVVAPHGPKTKATEDGEVADARTNER